MFILYSSCLFFICHFILNVSGLSFILYLTVFYHLFVSL